MRTIQQVATANDYLILDTETTGLTYPSEIIEINIIDAHATGLLYTRLKPKYAIPPQATDVHGIDDKAVSLSPLWPDVVAQVANVLSGRDVIVYNADYDRTLLEWTDSIWGHPERNWLRLCNWYCLMKSYAEYWGEYDSYHDDPRWQRLHSALHQQGLDANQPHSAVGDTLSTLALLKHLRRQERWLEQGRAYGA